MQTVSNAAQRSLKGWLMLRLVLALMLMLVALPKAAMGQTSSGTITVAVWDTAFSGNLLIDQVNDFTSATGIGVEIVPIPSAEYADTLLDQASMGELTDVVFTYYGLMTQLADMEALLILDEALVETDIEEFVVDAVTQASWQEALVGLPIYRDACGPLYNNVSVSAQSLIPDEAVALIEYLTGIERQVENYSELGIFPTREALYDELGLSCPPTVHFRPNPEEQAVAFVIAETLEETLAEQLDGAELNLPLATAVIIGEEEIELAPNTPQLMTAVPVTTVYDEETLPSALLEGVTLGAVRIGADTPFGEALEAYLSVPEEYGDFVVRCFDIESVVTCEFVNPSGETMELNPDVEETAQDIQLTQFAFGLPEEAQTGAWKPQLTFARQRLESSDICIYWYSDKNRYSWCIF